MGNKSDYLQMCNELGNMSLEEILQLVMEAETQEQKELLEAAVNYILQEKQKQAIERNLF